MVLSRYAFKIKEGTGGGKLTENVILRILVLMVHVIVLFPDTTIAELVKEVVYSDEFRDFLSAQQGSVVVRV